VVNPTARGQVASAGLPVECMRLEAFLQGVTEPPEYQRDQGTANTVQLHRSELVKVVISPAFLPGTGKRRTVNGLLRRNADTKEGEGQKSEVATDDSSSMCGGAYSPNP
jgi:hypothetical protein